MEGQVKVSKIIFILFSVVLVGGIIFSFWYSNYLKTLNSDVIEPMPKVIDKKECIVTGCSGQICAEEEVMSTCEYKDEYVCYKDAKCEVQDNGECGWTMDSSLEECLDSASTESYQ